MKAKPFFRLLAMALSIVMIFSVFPISAFAASVDYVEKEGDYYKVISKKDWELAPGIVESEIVLNNAIGSQRNVAHVVEVDINNEYTKVIPSYKGMIPTPGNYGVQTMAKQAAFAEANGYGNVVAAMNISLSWYDSAYYKQNPHLVGEPLGYMILDGVQYTNSQGQTAGAQTCAVINFDEKDGVARPADIPKVEIRASSSPVTGWEEQVIPANFGFLVKDGKNQYSENHSNTASRSFIGIKEDGTFVMVMNDGRQAPFSAGFSEYEMAEFMLSLGCVAAINGDGGGSSQFLSQRPGEELELHCSPSDGAPRETTHGILVISTAPATGEFVRATIESENKFFTPGSSVQFTAVGSDLVGTPAEIPADVTWQMADPSMGTIENGLFVSNGKTGTATAQMVYEGKVVGEASVEIVIPTAFNFTQSVMTVPFDKTVSISLVATINDGLNEVVIKPEDITFSTTNAALGVINGFEFTSVSEANAPANLTSTLTATLNCANLTANAALNLGKGSEVLFDFENKDDMSKWGLGWLAGNNNEPYTVLTHATAETGKVYRGNGAMKFSCDIISGGTVAGSWTQAEIYPKEDIVIENAKTIGFWMYIPDEFTNLAVRIFYYYPTADGTEKIAIAQPFSQGHVYDNIEESGWYYVSTDISAYSYIKFRANKYFAEIMLSPAEAAGMPLNVGTVTGPLNIYIDDITVDYSDAVDDREAPVFGDVTLNTTSEVYVSMKKHEIVESTNNILNVSAAVSENTAKNNATGLDVDSAKAYIDGREVAVSYSNGRMSINDVAVADGVHRIKFEIADKMGNKAVVVRLVNVKSGVDASTVQVAPRNAALDRLYGGSVYWMDVKATDIETIQSVTAIVDLNSYNHWELDHMELAEGFTAEYSVDAESNSATITITRTGENNQVGAAVLASLPIRVAYYGTDFGVAGMTPEAFWNNHNFWPMDVKVDVDYGEITYVDGYTSDILNTFSNEAVSVDTELYDVGKVIDAAFKAERGSVHVHTATAMADLKATCTEDGYTGRTYCAVCDSVVAWGTTVPATGHDWKINADGKLACANTGNLFTGVYTDGKEYVDGVVVADGWNEDNTSYYVDGVKLTGSNFVGGVMLTFDENGIYLPDYKFNGFYEINDTVMYFENNEYLTGYQWIETEFYNFDKNGFGYDGEVEICGTKCLFEDGISVGSEDVLLAGICGEDVYYVVYSDGTLVVDGTGEMVDFVSLSMMPWWRQEFRLKINKIIVGNGITRIGQRAFVNTYATEVVFEEGSQLVEISHNAFAVMDKLTTITLPDGVKILDTRSFYDCAKLADVYLPASVTTFYNNPFENSPNVVLHVAKGSSLIAKIESLNLNYVTYEYVGILDKGTCGENVNWELYTNGLLKITGSGAMTDFESAGTPWYKYKDTITKVEIDKDITTIGKYSFYKCENLEEVVFAEDSALQSINKAAFGYTSIKTIAIPVNVELIDEHAFYENDNLEEIKIEEQSKLTTIGRYAFCNLPALKSLYIPDGVSFIGASAFVNTTNVTVSVVKESYAESYMITNGVAYVTREAMPVFKAEGTCGDNAEWKLTFDGTLVITGSGAMADYETCQAPWYQYAGEITAVEIGKDITYIGKFSFFQCRKLETVIFEEGTVLNTIGWGAFGRTGIKEVTIPATVETINDYAFYQNDALEEVKFEEGSILKSIRHYAFRDLPALKTVYIPSKVEFIGDLIFWNSKNVVASVEAGSYAEKSMVRWGFAYVTREPELYVKAEGTCGDNAEWTLYSNGLLAITGSGAMADFESTKSPWYRYAKEITAVEIGKDITSIGTFSFYYLSNVKTVTFAEGSALETINRGAFGYMGIEEVTIPATVTKLDRYAFYFCGALKTVNFAEGSQLTLIDAYAFRGTPVLEEINGVPAGAKISAYAFYESVYVLG